MKKNRNDAATTTGQTPWDAYPTGAALLNPDDMAVEELRPFARAYHRKMHLGQKPINKKVQPCKQCSTELTARQRRYACPKCGTYNREVSAATKPVQDV